MLGPWILSVIFTAYCAFSIAEGAVTFAQMEKMAKGIRDGCVNKIGLDPDLVAGIKNGQFPENKDLACYTNCVMKTLRTFKNEKIDVDMVVKQVDLMMPAEIQDRIKAGARKCGAEAVNDDPCQSTYMFVKCTYENDPEVFFFP